MRLKSDAKWLFGSLLNLAKLDRGLHEKARETRTIETKDFWNENWRILKTSVWRNEIEGRFATCCFPF